MENRIFIELGLGLLVFSTVNQFYKIRLRRNLNRR